MHFAIGTGRGGEGGELQGIQTLATIAIADHGEMAFGLGGDFYMQFAQAAFFIRNGLVDEALQVLNGEGFEGEHLGSAHERAVDVEEGIVRGSPDEPQGAALQMGEQHILLGFVEAVDLIHKQDGADAVEALFFLRRVCDHADLGHVALHAAQGDEAGVRLVGDDGGQGGLAHAWGPVEDEGGEPVGHDGPAQEFAFP